MARNWDPARAAADLASLAAWRAGFMPQGRVLDSEVPNEIAQDKSFLQVRPGGAGVSRLPNNTLL